MALRAVIVSDFISGSLSDVNQNKLKNHKNSTFSLYGWHD